MLEAVAATVPRGTTCQAWPARECQITQPTPAPSPAWRASRRSPSRLATAARADKAAAPLSKAAAAASLRATSQGATQHPEDADAQWHLVVVLDEPAEILGDPVPAYGRALGLIEALDHKGQLSASGKATFGYLSGQLGASLAKADDDRGAIAVYDKSIAFDQSLVARDPWDVAFRRDLAFSFRKLAFAKVSLNDDAGALAAFQDTMATTCAIARQTKDPSDQLAFTKAMGFTCYSYLREQRWGLALALADKAVEIAPDELWIQANRADALMMLGRTDEARTIYLAYRGKIAQDQTLLEPAVEDDFKMLRKLGATSPLMAEIEADFAKPAPVAATR